MKRFISIIFLALSTLLSAQDTTVPIALPITFSKVCEVVYEDFAGTNGRSLSGVFAQAVTQGGTFDPTYSGSKDRLTNFRGYEAVVGNPFTFGIGVYSTPALACAGSNTGYTVYSSDTTIQLNSTLWEDSALTIPAFPDGVPSGTVYTKYLDSAVRITVNTELCTVSLIESCADTEAPTQVTGVTAVQVLSNPSRNVDLTWNAATDNVGVVNYILYRKIGGGNYDVGNDVGNVTEYTDTNIKTDGLTYYYKLKAEDAAENISTLFSSEVNITADISAPDIPSGLDAIDEIFQVTISWDSEATSGANFYELQSKLGIGGSYSTIYSGANLFYDHGVTTGLRFYKVRSRDQYGNFSTYSSAISIDLE